MFESYDTIDWSKFDVAPRREDLAVLASKGSVPAAVRRAFGRLTTAIYDQGCAGAVTTKTVPLLLEVLSASPTAVAKEHLVALLADMLTDDADFVFEPFSRRGPLVAAIRKGERVYTKLLTDPAPRVRAQAARILAYHSRTGARLTARCAHESDPRTQATCVLAAAIQKQSPGIPTAKSALVLTSAALAKLLTRRKLDEATAKTLLASLDDTKLDADFPFFGGCLRAAVVRALGKFGRGHRDVIDALLALRARTPMTTVPKTTLGSLAIVALAEIAVPTKGKLDAAGEAIVRAMLDVSPGWALEAHGLPADPNELVRLLGDAPPERSSRLNDRLGSKTVRDSVLDLVLGQRPYDPKALLARLMKLKADARVDVVVDLLKGRDKLDRLWTYGKLDPHDRMRAGEESMIAKRRRARMHDVCLRLLCETGQSIAKRLDREIGVLATSADAARKTLPKWEQYNAYKVPIAVLALARAMLHVRARERLPPRLREQMRSAVHFVFAQSYVRELLPALGRDLAPYLRGTLWWHADEQVARAALTKWVRANVGDAWVTPPAYNAVSRLAKAVDARSLERLLREVAKSSAHDRKPDFVWTAPNGQALTITTGLEESEVDQVFEAR